MTYVIGDALAVLRTLEADRFQTCVTSPPYWGLRDYDHVDQLGREPTPDEYVARLVQIMREVRRVLRPDGTLWLNLGDSYVTRWGSQRKSRAGLGDAARKRSGRVPAGMKEKDLAGIPWMVAFALRADGWWLRQDVIWAKPNPVPEPVKDRCTRAHEYLFMLTRSQNYFYDADAIREPHASAYSHDVIKRAGGAGGVRPAGNNFSKARRRADGTGTPRSRAERAALLNPKGRNKRSVWTINTQPYRGAHFAVFPPALVEPCILAGSRPGDEVLDPFFGSGTVGEVAARLGRRWLGVELQPSYASLIDARTQP